MSDHTIKSFASLNSYIESVRDEIIKGNNYTADIETIGHLAGEADHESPIWKLLEKIPFLKIFVHRHYVHKGEKTVSLINRKIIEQKIGKIDENEFKIFKTIGLIKNGLIDCSKIPDLIRKHEGYQLVMHLDASDPTTWIHQFTHAINKADLLDRLIALKQNPAEADIEPETLAVLSALNNLYDQHKAEGTFAADFQEMLKLSCRKDVEIFSHKHLESLRGYHQAWLQGETDACKHSKSNQVYLHAFQTMYADIGLADEFEAFMKNKTKPDALPSLAKQWQAFLPLFEELHKDKIPGSRLKGADLLSPQSVQRAMNNQAIDGLVADTDPSLAKPILEFLNEIEPGILDGTMSWRKSVLFDKENTLQDLISILKHHIVQEMIAKYPEQQQEDFREIYTDFVEKFLIESDITSANLSQKLDLLKNVASCFKIMESYEETFFPNKQRNRQLAYEIVLTIGNPYLSNAKSEGIKKSLLGLMEYAVDINGRKSYQPAVIARGIHILMENIKTTANSPADQIIKQMGSINENKPLKGLLRQPLLQAHMEAKAKAYCSIEGYQYSGTVSKFAEMISKKVIVEYDLPEKIPTLDYLDKLLEFALEALLEDKKPSETLLSALFSSNIPLSMKAIREKKLSFGKKEIELWKKKLEEASEPAPVAEIKPALSLQAKLIPLTLKLLPGLLQRAVPNLDRKDKEVLQLQVQKFEQVLEQSGLAKPDKDTINTLLPLGVQNFLTSNEEMTKYLINIIWKTLSTFTSTGEKVGEILKGETLTQKNYKSSLRHAKVDPIAASLMEFMMNQIIEIKGKSQKIGIEGKDDVPLTMIEEILIRHLPKAIGVKASLGLTVANISQKLVSGRVGNWLATHITKIIINAVMDAKIPLEPQYKRLLKENRENVAQIIIKMLPGLMQNHNFERYIAYLRYLNTEIRSKEPLDIKQFTINTFDMLQLVGEELSKYKEAVNGTVEDFVKILGE